MNSKMHYFHLVIELTTPNSSAKETLVEKLIIEIWVGLREQSMDGDELGD